MRSSTASAVLRRLDDRLWRERFDVFWRGAETGERLQPGLQHLPVGVDAPKSESAVSVRRIEKDRDGHRQIDPVRGRHQVHEPGEISVRQFGLAVGEKLARLVGQRRLILDFAEGGGLSRTKFGNSSLRSIRKATRSARCTQVFVMMSVSTCATSLWSRGSVWRCRKTLREFCRCAAICLAPPGLRCRQERRSRGCIWSPVCGSTPRSRP